MAKEDNPIEETSSKSRVAKKSPPPKTPSQKRGAQKRPTKKRLIQTTKSPQKKKCAKAPTKYFQYRSNLRPFFELIDKKTFLTGQIEALKKTPFWLLLKN
ncbi:hypothetical protein RHGRI_030789 [Rhododendron griersonianum]|uniref:Uncharacterized protein n=1 Tax=Rhododendron griersonianum TaxID=479676 RepID=A0AAV6IB96_9ERIC|nr:hypothetical protein RHGRI_030789 [Rhododendron griersonianum]